MQVRSRRWVVVALAVIAILAAVGYHMRGPHKSWLVVRPGAKGFFYLDGPVQSAGYQLMERYPASQAIAAISATLQRQGWRPIDECYVGSVQPKKLREWHDVWWWKDKQRLPRREWVGCWSNAQGDVVQYDLLSYTPNPSDRLGVLRVEATHFPAEMVEQFRKQRAELEAQKHPVDK